MRVSILGGGGFRVPLIVAALRSAGLDMSELVLYDISPERLTVIASVLAGGGALVGGGAAGVDVTMDLDEALRGTDLIFAALRPGGLDGRVSDERTALGLGVLGQETVGAGGLSSAARAVPLADSIARRIRVLAPGAWVITMTNPAGIVTEVMARSLGRRVIGVCDSPVGLVRRARAAAGPLASRGGLAFDPARPGEIPDGTDVDYLGINHLGWLRRLFVDGTDVLPGLLASPERLRLTPFPRPAITSSASCWRSARPSDQSRRRPCFRRPRPGHWRSGRSRCIRWSARWTPPSPWRTRSSRTRRHRGTREHPRRMRSHPHQRSPRPSPYRIDHNRFSRAPTLYPERVICSEPH